MDKLNEYADAEGDSTWSRWGMLHLNGGSINSLGADTQNLGLLKSAPVPVKKGEKFLYWCEDAERIKKYNSQTADASRITDLYAFWTDNFFLTFDFENGTEAVVVLDFNDTIQYPEGIAEREGYTLNGWAPSPERMPAEDVVVRVQWLPNSYTVTFDGNGGIPSKLSMRVAYNSAYGELPTANKTDHTFVGWFTEAEDGEEVTSESTFKTLGNQTLYAHWEEIPTKQVEIVFEKRDLSDEEIRDVVEQFTEAEFTIIRVEDESGEVKVIIKFDGIEQAKEFVRKVNGASRSAKSVLKRVGFVPGDDSFSPPLALASFVCCLLSGSVLI